MKEKVYCETENVRIMRQPYWSILPTAIFMKEEPNDLYKGYCVHLGFLCFSVDLNW